MNDAACSYGCTDHVAAKCCPTHGTQAHAMSQPNMHSDGKPMQHLTLAALGVIQQSDRPKLVTPESSSVFAKLGLQVSTVGEWQRLVDEIQLLERSASGMHARMRVKDSIITDLQRQLRERKDGQLGNAHRDRGAVSCMPVAVLPDLARNATLTMLPEPDARLGRGNAAMDAGE